MDSPVAGLITIIRPGRLNWLSIRSLGLHHGVPDGAEMDIEISQEPEPTTTVRWTWS